MSQPIDIVRNSLPASERDITLKTHGAFGGELEVASWHDMNQGVFRLVPYNCGEGELTLGSQALRCSTDFSVHDTGTHLE